MQSRVNIWLFGLLGPWACWGTEGLGLGPYSQCNQPSDCAARDETICLERTVEHAAPEPLFCSHACATDDPSDCPLGDIDPSLVVECLPIVDSETRYCALVTHTTCPETMMEYKIDTTTVCVFPD